MSRLKAGNDSPRITELDGLRAVAILMVIAFHSWFFLINSLPSFQAFEVFSNSLPGGFGFIRRGDAGVDIFFTLSGFLLSWQLFSEKSAGPTLNFRRFYMRRVFRIYPLYLFVLGLVAIRGGGGVGMLGNIFAYNIWFHPTGIVLPWSWSLSAEIEFYAIVPLLILWVRNGRDVVIVVTLFALGSIGWSCWTLAAYPALGGHSLIDLAIGDRRDDVFRYLQNVYVAMPIRISQFMLGLAAAWVAVEWKSRAFSMSGIVYASIVILVICGALAPLAYNPYSHLENPDKPFLFLDFLFGRLLFSTSVAMTILMMRIGRFSMLKTFLSLRFLEPVARFSFSMYLFHPLFVYLGIAAVVGAEKVNAISVFQYLGIFGIGLGGAMSTGFLTWYLLERPAIRIGRHWFG
ncbi:MAG: acyltransferase family protein [Paracoccaceae bacterium]